MQKLIFIFIFLVSINSHAQINGITETGDEIILFENGTWQYVNDSLNVKVETLKNKTIYVKEKNATFLVKSNNTNIGIYINPKDWNFKKGEAMDDADLVFEHKHKDLYGMILTEKIELPLESLANIAYDNAKSAATNVQIKKKDLRQVNDREILMMQMTGNIQGIDFIYYGYYYSDENGAHQILTYTSQNLFDEYKNDMEKFLNGMVLTD